MGIRLLLLFRRCLCQAQKIYNDGFVYLSNYYYITDVLVIAIPIGGKFSDNFGIIKKSIHFNSILVYYIIIRKDGLYGKYI